MARFIDEPIKNPLSGNEVGAATDPSTMNDVGWTPFTIIQFAQLNMALASGTSRGLISGGDADKLHALDTQAQNQAITDQLAEVALPAFFGHPADGAFNFYYHTLSVSWLFSEMFCQVSAGSTNLTITKNGVPMGGATSVPITTAGQGSTFSDSPPLNEISSGDRVGISFTGTTGNCANLIVSINANAIIVP